MGDWKDVEDVNQPCSSENGWCGMCGRCTEHWQDLQDEEEWGDE